MNSLFLELTGAASNPRPAPASGVPSVIQDAAAQGFSLNVGDFLRFAQMLKGKGADPAAIVRELRDSGQLSEAQFNDLKNKAQGFMGLLKLVAPKK